MSPEMSVQEVHFKATGWAVVLALVITVMFAPPQKRKPRYRPVLIELPNVIASDFLAIWRVNSRAAFKALVAAVFVALFGSLGAISFGYIGLSVVFSGGIPGMFAGLRLLYKNRPREEVGEEEEEVKVD
eukprot:Hpha_TRINITY_DN17193_c0_g1::TRINITY_DN17193_c0_g1_i1::g.146849::m.146849